VGVCRKVVGGVLAGIAVSGLMFAGSAPAAAHEGKVLQHWHCLWTPEGWVPLAEGVSEQAPNEPALHQFHDQVHTGVPGSGGEPLIIRAIFSETQTCEDLAPPVTG
jgi:hypothetical protein